MKCCLNMCSLMGKSFAVFQTSCFSIRIFLLKQQKYTFLKKNGFIYLIDIYIYLIFYLGSFMFLFCLVFAMFCARLFICALWSPAGKGLTSWLSFVVSSVSLSLSHWYPGSGVVLDCIDSWSLQPYYFKWSFISNLSAVDHKTSRLQKNRKKHLIFWLK